MRRRVLQAIATAMAAIAPFRAFTADLLYYDPAAKKDDDIPPPDQPVEVDIDPLRELITIPPRFYGINVHPGSARYEYSRIDLLKALKPDAVRIMTRLRADWPPGGKGRIVTPLSPAPGQYHWDELDLIVQGIVDIGAEPYLALGFGPPHWMSGARLPIDRRPPQPDKLDEYARFMATIVHRYAVEKSLPIKRVTIENEPENVGYAIGDYITLVRRAREAIRARAPTIEIGGPTTGYANWPQPDKSSLGFAAFTRRLKDAAVPFDFFDWHIYSTSAGTILRTVKAVRAIYGDSIPLVISEINRDWRYSGNYRRASQEHNTGWESLAWLAYVYDNLQVMGISQVFYFNWRETTLGLTDAKVSEIRPNYYLLWTLTNKLGRRRVFARTGSPALGCIATVRDGLTCCLVYNRSKSDVSARVRIKGNEKYNIYPVDQKWVAKTKSDLTRTPQILPVPMTMAVSADSVTTVPGGGFILLEQTSQPT